MVGEDGRVGWVGGYVACVLNAEVVSFVRSWYRS